LRAPSWPDLHPSAARKGGLPKFGSFDEPIDRDSAMVLV